jgi:peptide-methionine (S)-S-oxide reductase
MSPMLLKGGAILGAAVIATVALGEQLGAARAPVTVPAPAVAFPLPLPEGPQSVVFSGGCFWGVQGVFEHVKGVISATSGYAGGGADQATYEQVSGSETGHAESVRVVYDPAQVSFGQLLQVFFSVVHDPTQKNRQGPDVGTQYRSAVWYTTDDQRQAALSYIEQLTEAKAFSRPIVTEVNALTGFYPAEEYHQDYLIHHPDQPYIAINDLPKVRNLRRRFPQLWRAEPLHWRAEALSAREQ